MVNQVCALVVKNRADRSVILRWEHSKSRLSYIDTIIESRGFISIIAAKSRAFVLRNSSFGSITAFVRKKRRMLHLAYRKEMDTMNLHAERSMEESLAKKKHGNLGDVFSCYAKTTRILCNDTFPQTAHFIYLKWQFPGRSIN